MRTRNANNVDLDETARSTFCVNKYLNSYTGRSEYLECILVFLCAMRSGGTVVSIYALILTLHHQLMTENILSSMTLNWTENLWT